ncbi:unnamed protein product [Schistocephalus solidus]|uniref:Uncharacterized protein n=1 Tax=Schistocephalus solidus TaxID=70667 RepID=A0A183SSI2_SCHSO|nr:unnamed protein product [Schistocephalus solidus]
MDPFSLMAEHCANSGHTFAIQNAKILGWRNDRVTRETIEAWHMETSLINRCVALQAAYQALRALLIELKSKQEIGPSVNPTTGGPRTGMHLTRVRRRRSHQYCRIKHYPDRQGEMQSEGHKQDEQHRVPIKVNADSGDGRQLSNTAPRRETCQLTVITILLPPSHQ